MFLYVKKSRTVVSSLRPDNVPLVLDSTCSTKPSKGCTTCVDILQSDPANYFCCLCQQLMTVGYPFLKHSKFTSVTLHTPIQDVPTRQLANALPFKKQSCLLTSTYKIVSVKFLYCWSDVNIFDKCKGESISTVSSLRKMFAIHKHTDT